MKVVTITCIACKKDSYVSEEDFPLYCPFCGSRSTIYYKPEIGELKSETLTGEMPDSEKQKKGGLSLLC